MIKILGALLISFLLFTSQDTTKNVLSSDQDTSVIVTDMDSCDFRMDTAYAGHLYREAKVLMDSGEYELALEKLSNAETHLVNSSGGVDTLLIIIHNMQGDLYERIGNYCLSQFYLEKALSICSGRPSLEKLYATRSYHLLGITFQNMGQYHKAIHQNRRVLEIKKDMLGHKNMDLANTYNNLGVSLRALGSYEESASYINKAVIIKEYILGMNDPEVAHSYLNIGNTWNSMGDYMKAIHYYKRALRVILEHYNDDFTKLIHLSYVYNNLGDALINTGDVDRAIEYLQKSIVSISEAVGDRHYELVSNYITLGTAHYSISDYNKAIEHYQHAISISHENNDNSLGLLAAAYNNIGVSLRDQGEYDKAILYFEKGLSIHLKTKGPKSPSVARSYNNIGIAWTMKKDYVQALEYFNRSKSSVGYDSNAGSNFDQVIDLMELRTSLLEENIVFTINETQINAERLIDSIRANYIILLKLESYIQYNLSTSWAKQYYSSQSIPVYEGAIDNLMIRDRKEEIPQTFEIAEKLKGRQLSEKMKEASYSTSFGIPDSLKEKEYVFGIDITYYEKKKFKEEYESQEKNDSLISIYDNKLFKLNQKRDELQELFKIQFPNYYNARYSQNVIPVSRVKDSLLNPDQALVEYFIGDSSIFTFTILPDTLYVHQIKKDFPLNTLVEDMLHGIYDPYTSTTDSARQYSYTQAAQQIYQKVFYHVDTLLPEGTDIILVPDGILGYIPFDALLTDSLDSESYLIRDHQISYTYSATLQAEMENMQHDKKAKKRIVAFAPSFNQSEVFGDTTYLASRSIDVTNERNWLTPLKYNDDEVRSISEMAGADLFLDSTATKDQFLQHASDYSVIHLSTHGKANDKMGDYSFLAFYDPKDSTESWLYNRELYGLKLNADMVVLSACETGIGELQRGEGIISLARGFSYAGAKSIVTTLWSVNDRSTQKIMELFYGNLTEGMRKDEALRKAKLDYLDNYPNLGSAPYYWAGIIPIGDMSPVELGSNVSWAWYILSVLISVSTYILCKRLRISHLE